MSRLKSSLTRSAPFSPIRLASSPTVMASGTMTSRTCFSRGFEGPPCMRRSFSRARLSAASERARRPSSSLRALLTVSLPARRLSGFSAVRAALSSFFLRSGFLGSGRAGVSAAVSPAAAAGSSAGCCAGFCASSVAALAASSSALRFSSARFFWSSAAWRACSSSRLRASSLWRRRSSSASRCRRATRSCGVSSAGAAGFLGAAFLATGAGAGSGAGGGGGGGGGAAGGVSPGFTSLRRRFTSTATLLVRPWLKVCLTSPG